jgi:hypothetical protein
MRRFPGKRLFERVVRVEVVSNGPSSLVRPVDMAKVSRRRQSSTALSFIDRVIGDALQ